MSGIPQLPVGLVVPDSLARKLPGIWKEICEELLDPKYASRTHNKRTYDAGCRGPVCLKASRDAGRRRLATSKSPIYQTLDPIIDAWSPLARQRIEEEQAEILRRIASA